MIEGHVEFVLGGKHWSIPPLKWKTVKFVEPAFFGLYRAAKDAEEAGALTFDEPFLDRLASLVFRVACCADPDDGDPPPKSREAFEDLEFRSADLVALLPLVGKVSGLVKAAKGNGQDQGESDAGKQTGTVLSLTPAPLQDGPPPPS
jgi:hypothetical protein